MRTPCLAVTLEEKAPRRQSLHDLDKQRVPYQPPPESSIKVLGQPQRVSLRSRNIPAEEVEGPSTLRRPRLKDPSPPSGAGMSAEAVPIAPPTAHKTALAVTHVLPNVYARSTRSSAPTAAAVDMSQNTAVRNCPAAAKNPSVPVSTGIHSVDVVDESSKRSRSRRDAATSSPTSQCAPDMSQTNNDADTHPGDNAQTPLPSSPISADHPADRGHLKRAVRRTGTAAAAHAGPDAAGSETDPKVSRPTNSDPPSSGPLPLVTENHSKLHPPGGKKIVRIIINPIPKPGQNIDSGPKAMSQLRKTSSSLNKSKTGPQQTIKKNDLASSRHLPCDHKARRTQCALCHGGSVCMHGRQKHLCKDCGGKSLCEHLRQRSKCQTCSNK